MNNLSDAEFFRIYGAGKNKHNEKTSDYIARLIQIELSAHSFHSKSQLIDHLSQSFIDTLDGKDCWSYSTLDTIFKYQPWLEAEIEHHLSSKKRAYSKRTRKRKNTQFDVNVNEPVPINYTSQYFHRGEWAKGIQYTVGQTITRTENLAEGKKVTRYVCLTDHLSNSPSFSTDLHFKRWRVLNDS